MRADSQLRSVRATVLVQATLGTRGTPGNKVSGWPLGCASSCALPCRHCPPSDACARVLHCGCGNSLLGCQLAAAGYEEVVNTDVAANVIAVMRARFPDTPGLSWCALGGDRAPDSWRERHCCGYRPCAIVGTAPHDREEGTSFCCGHMSGYVSVKPQSIAGVHACGSNELPYKLCIAIWPITCSCTTLRRGTPLYSEVCAN